MDTGHQSKRLSNPILHYGILLFIFAVATVTLLSHTIFHAGHQHNEDSTDASSLISNYPPCPGQPAHDYTLTITNKGINPEQITANRCDQLTIANDTSSQISPAFGPHEHHYDYPGFNEEVLAPKQSNTLRLYQSGTFPIHDHFNEGLRATITINN